ncbi:phage distal tail protein, Rcc01695 family [Oricola sp.]|uniref:phage distal tail protein, Rcc01695 family n=1 Tax=Oricola sp. TaxID=1979950 RepID=UPI003BA87E4F
MVFHDVSFPARLAFGASGGPERRVEIVRLASGQEQRNARWSRSKRRYTIATGVKALADLHTLSRFFEERGGPLHGFRFRDPVDHLSAPPGQAIGPFDVTIGSGDGSTTAYQLALATGRLVTKPISATVRVAVGGQELASPADFTIDALTGVVTLAAPPAMGVAVTAGFEFDVPVRFGNDELPVTQVSFEAGEIAAIQLVEVFE